MKLRVRIARAWAAWKGDELRAQGYPKVVLLGGGLWSKVYSPEDEARTRGWIDRVAGWNGEHSA